MVERKQFGNWILVNETDLDNELAAIIDLMRENMIESLESIHEDPQRYDVEFTKEIVEENGNLRFSIKATERE